ncbi:MAG: glutamate synthase central domain-containing protein [Chloroflexota bacterium]
MMRAESRRKGPHPVAAHTGPVALPIVAPTTTTPLAALGRGPRRGAPGSTSKTMALGRTSRSRSMGDDTPTPGCLAHGSAAGRPPPGFAQVANPPIDPERERIVMDLTVELGRRPALLAPLHRPEGRTLRLPSPFVADLASLEQVFARLAGGQASGTAGDDACASSTPRGTPRRARAASPGASVHRHGGVRSRGRRRRARGALHRRFVRDGRLPVGSVLAAGATRTALTDAGLRGQADVVVDGSRISGRPHHWR